MLLVVKRRPSSFHATLGELLIENQHECFTLEDVVRETKVAGVTAIPPGNYRVTIDFSSRFQRDMPHVLDVPNFTGVRIHSGNTDEDTEGCILVGTKISGPDFISESRDAFNTLFNKIKHVLDSGDVVWLSIS